MAAKAAKALPAGKKRPQSEPLLKMNRFLKNRLTFYSTLFILLGRELYFFMSSLIRFVKPMRISETRFKCSKPHA